MQKTLADQDVRNTLAQYKPTRRTARIASTARWSLQEWKSSWGFPCKKLTPKPWGCSSVRNYFVCAAPSEPLKRSAGSCHSWNSLNAVQYTNFGLHVGTQTSMHVTNSSRSIGEEKTKFIRLDHMNSHDSEGKANVAQKWKYQPIMRDVVLCIPSRIHAE